MTLLAGEGLDAGHTVLARLVREHGPVDHVADGIDAGHRGLEVAVDGNAAALGHLHADLVQAEALHEGAAADRNQDDVGFQRLGRAAFRGLDRQRHAGAGRLGLGDLGAELELQPLLGERALEELGDLVVHAWRDAVEELDHRHVGAETAPHRAQFEADDAGADHDEALRHLAEFQRASRGDDLLLVDRHARQRHHFRARGDQDVLRGQRILHRAIFTDDRDGARRLDTTGPGVRGDLVLLEQEGDALGRGLDDLALALHELREIELRRRHDDSVRGEIVARFLEQVRGLQQRLRGDAADVEAGAAKRRTLLDDGDLEAELRGADRGDVATGAGADHDNIEGFVCHWRTVLIAKSVSSRAQRGTLNQRREKVPRCARDDTVVETQTPSRRRSGSSMQSLTLTRNSTASRPSMMRWS